MPEPLTAAASAATLSASQVATVPILIGITGQVFGYETGVVFSAFSGAVLVALVRTDLSTLARWCYMLLSLGCGCFASAITSIILQSLIRGVPGIDFSAVEVNHEIGAFVAASLAVKIMVAVIQSDRIFTIFGAKITAKLDEKGDKND